MKINKWAYIIPIGLAILFSTFLLISSTGCGARELAGQSPKTPHVEIHTKQKLSLWTVTMVSPRGEVFSKYFDVKSHGRPIVVLHEGGQMSLSDPGDMSNNLDIVAPVGWLFVIEER